MGQNEGPKWGYFLSQNALVIADFVLLDRKLWYLAANAGQITGKKFLSPKMGWLVPKRGQNEVFSLFLILNAKVFANIVYFDKNYDF